MEEMVDKYYNSQKFNNTLKFFYEKYETPFDFFYDLGNYFESKGYFNRNIGNTEYYKVFLDFNMEILKGDESYLKDIIKYDYLSFNKRRGMPDFIKSNIDKQLELQIKDELRERYSFKDYQIEKFDIDMSEYLNTGKIIKKECFYLVGNNCEIIKI